MPGGERLRLRSRGGDDAARRRALADAAAGVVGSLLSVVAFYPVDVWKTSLQAGAAGTAPGDDGGGPASTLARALSRSFRGLPHKVAHTVVSSFTYFYVYSLVQTKYAQHLRSSGRKNAETSTAAKLLLTAFAAMINVGITLPLDAISARKQAGAGTTTTSNGNSSGKEQSTGSSNGGDEKKRCGAQKSNGPRTSNGAYEIVSNEESSLDYLLVGDAGGGCRGARSLSEEYHSANEDLEWEDDEREHRPPRDDETNETSSLEPPPTLVDEGSEALLKPDPHDKSGLYIKSPESYRFSFSTNLAREAFARADGRNRRDEGRRASRRRLRSILSLWDGLFPAMLLCANPAIQYTAYDNLKVALLRRRGDGGRTTETGGGQSNKLSVWEAFFFGLLSKFLATMATYPLIRCKVMLMVGGGGDGEGGPNDPAAAGDGRSAPREGARPRSLPRLLLHILRTEGPRGIYRGCSLQLLHTTLKSAMLMAARERIAVATHRLFQVDG